jgi:TorA-specific chaperone
MPGFVVTDPEERVFTLNAIELCAAVFRGPGPEVWPVLFAAGVPELLAHIPSRCAHLTNILKNLQELQVTAQDTETLAELESDAVRLFITAGGGVSAPPYESCHRGGTPRIMGPSALAMRDRLARTCLETADGEPPDHLAVELEYLYHLLATGWVRNDPVLETEGFTFAREVMLPWVECFARAVEAARPHRIFVLSAELLTGLLAALPRPAYPMA